MADDALSMDLKRRQRCTKVCGSATGFGTTTSVSLYCDSKDGWVVKSYSSADCTTGVTGTTMLHSGKVCDCGDIGLLSATFYDGTTKCDNTPIMKSKDSFVYFPSGDKSICGKYPKGICIQDGFGGSYKTQQFKGCGRNSNPFDDDEEWAQLEAELAQDMEQRRDNENMQAKLEARMAMIAGNNKEEEEESVFAAAIDMVYNSQQDMLTTVGIPLALLSSAALVYKLCMNNKADEYKALRDERV